MKRDKKITQFAKKLVELSKENGLVTETKVKEILAGLKQMQHRHHLTILKTFLMYIRREIKLQTAMVSTPVNLSEESLKEIEARFTQSYERPIKAVEHTDTYLIAGVRIRVGDDLYDSSIAGSLQRFAKSVH